MDKQQWSIVRQLFDQASLLPFDEQLAFIESQNVDTDIKQKVINMLAQQTQALSESNSLEPDADEPIRNIIHSNINELINHQVDLMVGNKIEQFSIVKLLGEGGMGQVFLAKRDNDDFEQFVAIKIIHTHKLSPSNQQRFKRERQILASLQHKNIASLVGGGQTDTGQSYIIMEYVEGVPIVEYCQEHKLSVKARLRLFKQVLSALRYAHQNLIIHRDIKATNVLVTPAGDVKLLDFGIAKLVEDTQSESSDANFTQTFERIMTPSSAAPEQVLGQAVTVLTDIYSLGALLLHMLTEETLFDSRKTDKELSLREIEDVILTQAPSKPSSLASSSQHERIRQLGKKISADIDTIVLKALNKEPERRYESAAQFLDDIERYLQGYPVLARPNSSWYSFSKLIKRNVAASVLATFLIVGLLSFSAVVSYQAYVIEQQRDKAISQAIVARQTANYLTQMFAKADPNVNDGELFTAKMLLDEALLSIDDLQIQGPVKAELLLTLSNVYRILSEYELAQELIDQANNFVNTQALDTDARMRLNILFKESQGDLDILTGNYVEAIQAHDDMIALLDSFSEQDKLSQQLFLDVQESYFDAYYGKATAHTYQGDNEQSIVFYQKALQVVKGQSNLRAKEADGLLGLGHAFREKGLLEESKNALTQGIAITRELQPRPNLDFAHGLNQLASTHLRLDDLEAAKKYATEGLQIRQDLLPEGHIEISASQGILANILGAQQEYQQAIELREVMLENMISALGSEHPFVGITQAAIGNLHLRLGQAKQAETHLLKAIDITTKAYSPTHNHVGRFLMLLGHSYLLQSNIEQAQESLNKASTILTPNLDKEHHFLAQLQILTAFTNRKLTADEEEKLKLMQKVEDAKLLFRKTYPSDTFQYRALEDAITRLTALD